jgi:hypothetical protein
MCEESNCKGEGRKGRLLLHVDCKQGRPRSVLPPTLPLHASCYDAVPATETTLSTPEIVLPLNASCYPNGMPPGLKIPELPKSRKLRPSLSESRSKSQRSLSPSLSPPLLIAPQRTYASSPNLVRPPIQAAVSFDGSGRELLTQRTAPHPRNLQSSNYGNHFTSLTDCNTPGCCFSVSGDGFRHSGFHKFDREFIFYGTADELTIPHPVLEMNLDKWDSETLRTIAGAIQDVPTRDLVFSCEEDDRQYQEGIFTDSEVQDFDRNRLQTLRRIQNILERRRYESRFQVQRPFHGQR